MHFHRESCTFQVYLVNFIGTALVLLNKHLHYGQMTIVYCHYQRSIPILHGVREYNMNTHSIQL